MTCSDSRRKESRERGKGSNWPKLVPSKVALPKFVPRKFVPRELVPCKLVPRKLAQRTSSRKFLSKPNVEKVQKKLFRSKIPSNLLQHVFKHFSTCRGRQELENKPKLEITASNGAKYQPGRICTRTMKRNNVRGKNAQRSRQMSKQQQDTRKKSTDIDRSRKNSLGTCIVLWGWAKSQKKIARDTHHVKFWKRARSKKQSKASISFS